jgi:hypothetical protein
MRTVKSVLWRMAAVTCGRRRVYQDREASKSSTIDRACMREKDGIQRASRTRKLVVC